MRIAQFTLGALPIAPPFFAQTEPIVLRADSSGPRPAYDRRNIAVLPGTIGTRGVSVMKGGKVYKYQPGIESGK
jgi:hypothetical protein